MAVKVIIFFCASALFVQSGQSACVPKPYSYGAGCGYNGLAAPALGYDRAAGYGCGTGVASTGGGLPCASASPLSPVGVSVLSENVYEGVLAAGGNLPFLGSVEVKGVLPTAGAGAVSYGCGDGVVGVGSEGPIATGIAVPGAVFTPGSPSAAATADCLAMVGNGLGYNGLEYNGLGYNGLGYNALGGIGKYGLGRGGCGSIGFNRAGCGAVF